MTQEAIVLGLIPLLPLLGALINGLLALAYAHHPEGPPRWAVAWFGCLMPFFSCVYTLQLVQHINLVSHRLEAHYFTWIAADSLRIGADLLLDRLAGGMAVVVTLVGFLIHLYSVGYMERDRGFARYFAYLNLFLFSMLLLVLARNLVFMFIGWEGVGLCSYLLIGFWFQRKDYAIAGNKAFIFNRIGDFGFVVGLFWLYWSLSGPNAAPLDLLWLRTHTQGLTDTAAEGIALLLFLGAVGKSAQVPLYVWLPDAMAGPTPVSALIHAATMVTAGVYLVARLHFLYALAPHAALTIAIIGTLTALWAALIAVAQNDIKKVLAYSTISQLGFMFLGVGTEAYAAGIFHLFTHAFFKALLFLGAGVLIHGLANEQDLRRMGGLARHFPLAHGCFLVATLAIVGIPPFAGFFSKDAILWYTWSTGHWFLCGLGLLTTGLTAFYMFRLYYLAFTGPFRGAVKPSAHGTSWTMGIPLILLATGSLVAGWIDVPRILDPLVPGPAGWLSYWMAPVFLTVAHTPGASHSQEWVLMGLALLCALAGIALATWRYCRPVPAEGGRPGWFLRLLQNKFYVDELYEWLFVRPLLWFSGTVLWKDFDTGLIDGTVNGLPQIYWGFSSAIRFLQAGYARLYALYLLLGLLGLVIFYTVRAMSGGG